VASILDGSITTEEGLQRVADAFSDSPEEFDLRANELTILDDFVGGTRIKEDVRAFLSVSEVTDDERIEDLRDKLLQMLSDTVASPSQLANREIENTWTAFHSKFIDYFAIKHDTVMRSHHLQEQFDEIMRSDEWWEFENLSKLPVAPKFFEEQAREICRSLRELDCKFNVREMLKTHPFCACSFSLGRVTEWEQLPARLHATIDKGRRSFRGILSTLREPVIKMLESGLSATNDERHQKSAKDLIALFKSGGEIRMFTADELIVLRRAFEALPNAVVLRASFPKVADVVGRADLRQITDDWLEMLPDDPVLIKI
jgi:hypothetical protein